jgi:4-amino-4-deoxy-L-arabinose transferase-like glycosyltransferase
MAVGSQMRMHAGRRGEAAALATEPRLSTTLACLAAFVAVWALYFTISEAPAAIHHDSAEAYVWGREFQLGYAKHPPFWAWICGLWFSVFPRTAWAFATLTSLNAGFGLCGAWMLIGDFADGRKRTAATVLLLLTPFYTFLSYRYNANSIFLSIWPWTLHFFVRSIEGRRLVDALSFGVLMGLALLSKYYALVLGATCFLAAVQHPTRWRYFGSFSPYVSVLATLVVCAPHAWWLLANDAPTVRYVQDEAGRGFADTAFYVAITLVGALAQNMVALGVVALTSEASPREWLASCRRQGSNAKFRLLVTLALAPIVLTALAAFAIGMKISTNMMIALFAPLPILAIEIAGAPRLVRLLRVSSRLAAAVTLGALVLSPVVALARAWLATDDAVTQPRKELAIEATRLWREKTSLPLAYVAGSFKYDNAVAFYSPDRPHAFEQFSFARSPWVTPQAIAAHGLLAVCENDDEGCLTSAAKFATPQTTRTELTLTHDVFGHKGRPARLVVTIVPPAS